MTDKEKLDQLFQAALMGDVNPGKSLERAFPGVTSTQVVSVSKTSVMPPVPAGPANSDGLASSIPAAIPTGQRLLVEPMPNLGLDEASSVELAALLDSQMKRVSTRRQREMLVTLAVIAGLAGGGFGWFVHSPSRVAAFQSAVLEIRSIGDIKGIMAKYQGALDKVGERSRQIDATSLSMGSDPATVPQGEDRYMEKETEEFTGEKGTGAGARKVQERFGAFTKSPGVTDQAENPSSSTVNR